MEWNVSDTRVAYLDAMEQMDRHVTEMLAQNAAERVWLLEHPPLYTAGTSARDSDLREGQHFPVHHVGRGGQYTYHGPGQRVAYVMLDLKKRHAMDLHRYVRDLERWLIATLAAFHVDAFVREGRVGVWVMDPKRGESKIAAIGIRVRGWVTFHGVALNVDPDLSHYAGIVPCGIHQYGVTSLTALGVLVSMEEVDMALKAAFFEVFGSC